MATRGRPRKISLEESTSPEAIGSSVAQSIVDAMEGPRYIVTGYDRAKELVERVRSAPPGSIIEMTNDEYRIWVDHVMVING